MTRDPVAFFAEHAARALVHGEPGDAWSAAGAVFNAAYPFGMPMEDYARRTLAQSRRAGTRDARRILEPLARFAIVEAVLEGALGEASEAERAVLARAVARRRGPARACPPPRRPAVGAVVLARADARAFTIANVRWGSAQVDQRWMHEDRLEALVRRLLVAPPGAPYVLAVAGAPRFSPSTLAFSTPDRLAVCHPEYTQWVDAARVHRLARCFAGRAPQRAALCTFRTRCRERALVADTASIDRELLRVAKGWGQDANRLHALLLPATDLELAVLGGAGAKD